MLLPRVGTRLDLHSEYADSFWKHASFGGRVMRYLVSLVFRTHAVPGFGPLASNPKIMPFGEECKYRLLHTW